jgi:transposase
MLRLRHKRPYDSKRYAPDEGHDKEAAGAAKCLRDQAEECGAHRSADLRHSAHETLSQIEPASTSGEIGNHQCLQYTQHGPADRLHADDTTVPVLDVGRTRTGRLWTYVRDDRPFCGADPPAAAYFYSPYRRGEHPEEHLASWTGLMQADAYAGFNRLYEAGRRPGPIVEAACWAHARRKFFDLARLNKAPIAIEAAARIDALFAVEREINGLPPDQRRHVRQERSRPRVETLEAWLRAQYTRLSAHSQAAKAIAYSLNGWDALVRFLDDGRLCMTNNAAEGALRCVAVGRNNWTFAGSDAGGRRAAAIYTLIETAKLNDIDPQAWLTDVLARLQDHPAKRIAELLPWNWKQLRLQNLAAD